MSSLPPSTTHSLSPHSPDASHATEGMPLSFAQNVGRHKDSTQPVVHTQGSATSESYHPPERQKRSSIAQPPLSQGIQDGSIQGMDNQPTEEIVISTGLPSDNRKAEELSYLEATSSRTAAKPENVRRLMGVPAFHPRDQQPAYIGQRNYNYEEKYPADKPGEEDGPDARFFKVYLDEAEIFDQERLRSHRDNLDSLLVFAALFSAVVTTFVVQTSQALQPDQGLITNSLLLYQIEILKVVGNATAISTITPSQYLPNTPTYSFSDVWVNVLFFASLSLSISTALLSVLAKQWLQAYDTTTSGSARDQALIRHLRFKGSIKWRLDEIIGALLLLRHASVAIFLIGLIVHLRALYPVLALAVIIISGISFMLYLASVVIPAVDIECPYRIPLLYRPMRYLVLFLLGCYGKMKKALIWLWTTFIKRIPTRNQNTMPQFRRAVSVTIDYIHTCSLTIMEYLQHVVIFVTPPLSLKDEERSIVDVYHNTCRYLHYSIAWVHGMSSNTSVQRISAQAIAGNSCMSRGNTSVLHSLKALCTPRLISTATEGLFDGNDIPTIGWNTVTHPSPWVRAVDNLSRLSSQLPNAPSTQEGLMLGITKAAGMGRASHVKYILKGASGDDVNKRWPSGGFVEETPLFAASANGHLSVIHVLLDHRADVNSTSWNLVSPLQIASFRGHLETVKLLLEKGADMNTAGTMHGSSLQAAAAQDHIEVVRLLLEKGADVNLEGGLLGYPLRAAVAYGNVDIVKLLIEKGADINTKFKGGIKVTLLQTAIERGYDNMAEILRSYGVVE